MARPLAQRMQVKPGHRLLVINPPEGYLESLKPLPDGVVVDVERASGVAYDSVHLFAQNKAAVDRDAPGAMAALSDGGLLWIAYPKTSSSMRSDISRDRGWETMGTAGWDSTVQVSVDDTWSALRFRPVKDIKYTEGSSRKRAGA
jgi:hypothetical protein